jgi:general secretion pathway protein F
VPNFRYRALTQNGEIVHGTLSAPTATEVAARIEYLRLLPIETIEEKRPSSGSSGLSLFNQP